MKSSNGSDNVAEKKYLSIGEVAEKFGVSVEVLRKWEKDFPRVLRPRRSSGETRQYDKKQQTNVAMILHLLREEGLSIEGAKKKLSSKQGDEEVRQEVISKLQGIRAQLMEVVEEIEKIEQNANPRPREGTIWYNK